MADANSGAALGNDVAWNTPEAREFSQLLLPELPLVVVGVRSSIRPVVRRGISAKLILGLDQQVKKNAAEQLSRDDGPRLACRVLNQEGPSASTRQ